jgi:hypothetical protein
MIKVMMGILSAFERSSRASPFGIVAGAMRLLKLSDKWKQGKRVKSDSLSHRTSLLEAIALARWK